MTNKGEFIRNYWKNYLFLENRFLLTDDYVSIEKENNDTFSYEFLSLFILICNEFDAVTTEFCNYIEGTKKRRDINDKMYKIRDVYPNLSEGRVIINSRFEGYNFMPFVRFPEHSADWWKDYTFVKHYRSQKDTRTDKPNYYKANLKNVFTALSALYLISCLFFEQLDDNETAYKLESRIFDGYEGI